jgi:predicted nucleotidyltransferase
VAPDLPPLVERVLPRLIRALAPERIVLFGSYAKGTANRDSDVDLLIIANTEGSAVHRQRLAQQLTADCFPRIDIVIATPSEVTSATAANSPFLASILTWGITLYTRPR